MVQTHFTPPVAATLGTPRGSEIQGPTEDKPWEIPSLRPKKGKAGASLEGRHTDTASACEYMQANTFVHMHTSKHI